MLRELRMEVLFMLSTSGAVSNSIPFEAQVHVEIPCTSMAVLI